MAPSPSGAYPETYPEIKEMIVGDATSTARARQIMRKAGFRQSAANLGAFAPIFMLLGADADAQATDDETPIRYDVLLAGGDGFDFTPASTSFSVERAGLYRASASLTLDAPSAEALAGHAFVSGADWATMQLLPYSPSTFASAPDRIELNGSAILPLLADDEASHVFFAPLGSASVGSVVQDPTLTWFCVEWLGVEA